MTGLQAEAALANVIGRHKPITNGAGWPVGCQCLDRIGFPAGRTWADHLAMVIEVEHVAGRVMSAKAEQRAQDWDAEKRARALAEKIDRCTAHMRDVLGYAADQPDAGLESLVVQAKHLRQRVHNHPPYRPTCNERQLPDGQLRGACLNDDGSDRG